MEVRQLRNGQPLSVLSGVPGAFRCGFFLLVCGLALLGQAYSQDMAPAAMRGEVCLNGDWQAMAAEDENTLPDPAKFTRTLPVPGVFKPRHGQEMPHILANKVWYRLEFPVPAKWKDGRRVSIKFRSVDHYGKIYLNRKPLGENYGPRIPFEFDITERCSFGTPNELLVYVEDQSRTISTPEAREKAMAEPWRDWKKRRAIARAPNDYPGREHMPGLNEDVFLRSTPPVHISDVFAKPSVRRMELAVQVWVTNLGTKPATVNVKNDVYLEGATALVLPAKALTVPPGETVDFTVSKKWANPKFWGYGEYGSATLYFVRTELTAANVRDTEFTRFGFRELWGEGKDFYFNGKKWFLQGDCDDVERYLSKIDRPYVARYLQVERMHNINNIRAGGDEPIDPNWFVLADEMGVTLQPCLGMSAFPNPTNRKNDARFAAEYTKSIRNHPSIVIINSNGEAASQGGGAISPGNDPEVWMSLKLAQDEVKKHDGTRLVCHDGSPRIMLSKKFGLDFPIDIWDVHPYGDPLVLSLRRHMKTFEYDGSVPCVLGEVVGKKVALPKDINLLKEYPEDTYHNQMLTAKYWKETIRDMKAEGIAGLRVLTLVGRAYWGATSLTEVVGGPYDGIKGDQMEIPWPSHSGTGLKTRTHFWGYKYGCINFLLSDRPLVVPNVTGQWTKEAYREANGGKDLPPVPDRRAPEVIMQVTSGGKPAANAYVYLTPLDGQASNVRGVMADSEGKAWFVLQEPGRYMATCAAGGKQAPTEITARWGSLANDPMPFGHVDTFQLEL